MPDPEFGSLGGREVYAVLGVPGIRLSTNLGRT